MEPLTTLGLAANVLDLGLVVEDLSLIRHDLDVSFAPLGVHVVLNVEDQVRTQVRHVILILAGSNGSYGL
jgi:hypothetical protein